MVRAELLVEARRIKGNGKSGVKGGVKSRGPIEIDTCWLPNSLTLSKSEGIHEGMRHSGYNVAPVVRCRTVSRVALWRLWTVSLAPRPSPPCSACPALRRPRIKVATSGPVVMVNSYLYECFEQASERAPLLPVFDENELLSHHLVPRKGGRWCFDPILALDHCLNAWMDEQVLARFWTNWRWVCSLSHFVGKQENILERGDFV